MSFFFISVFTISQSASTVWYYTTLKHTQVKMSKDHCFSTLWNYTTLKQSKTNWNCLWVSVPYEITLLSNNGVLRSPNDDVSVPYEITLLSNLVRAALSLIFVSVPYEITLLSNKRAECLKAIYSFSTLWNYTTLKPKSIPPLILLCFSTLWNYTTLKQLLSRQIKS